MAAILWDVDSSAGPRSLSSPRPTPADRFFEFVPDVVIIGPRRTAMGNGRQHAFKHRTDYTAHLAIRHLAPSQMADALDLKLWLEEGGEVTVVTDDAAGAEYDELTLRPGTDPKIDNEDDIKQHFSFRCDLRSAEPILVDYDA